MPACGDAGPGASDSNSDTAGDGDEGPSFCTEDEPADGLWNFVVRNERDTPIFVDAYVFCGTSGLQVEFETDASSGTVANPQLETCACITGEDCECGGGGESSPNTVWRLNAGVEISVSMQAHNFVGHQGCDLGSEGGDEPVCIAALTPEAVETTFRLAAGTATDGFDESPDDEESLYVDAGFPMGEQLQAEATVTPADGATIELVFTP